MPELPEVETVVRDLRKAGLVGCRIGRARVYWPRILEGLSPRQFCTRVRNRRIECVSRRGKFVVIRLSDGRHVLVHFRMTGQLAFSPRGTPRGPHQHLILELDDGRNLCYRDTRKFGRWRLLDDPRTHLGLLGPEPLDPGFTPRRFTGLLSARKGMLKPLLLNQGIVAGLGNIYVDEALFDAGLHPRRRCSTLGHEELLRLRRSIRKVLRRGIRARGTTLGRGQGNFYSVGGRRGRNQDGLRVFRRHGQACPKCGTSIRRIIVVQRSTHICPACQKPGAPA